jgi:hypothetical protein
VVGGDEKKGSAVLAGLDEPPQGEVEARDRLDVPRGAEVMAGAVDGPDVDDHEEGAISHHRHEIGSHVQRQALYAT